MVTKASLQQVPDRLILNSRLHHLQQDKGIEFSRMQSSPQQCHEASPISFLFPSAGKFTYQLFCCTLQVSIISVKHSLFNVPPRKGYSTLHTGFVWVYLFWFRYISHVKTLWEWRHQLGGLNPHEWSMTRTDLMYMYSQSAAINLKGVGPTQDFDN